jgi:hypothetical protein
MIIRVVEMAEYYTNTHETNSNDTEIGTKKTSKSAGINS